MKPSDRVVNVSNDFNKIEPISDENLNIYDSSINNSNYKVSEYNYSQGFNCQDKAIKSHININNVPYFDTPKTAAPSNYSSNDYSKNHFSRDKRNYNYNQCFDQNIYQNYLEYQQQYQASLCNVYYNQMQDY
jgi:hypothetical protein